MKIVITESQLELLKEYFSPMENIKAYMDYHLGFDKQKPYGANDFSKYKSIKLFQKFVDLAYKYTKKIADFDGVEKLHIDNLEVKPWGENINRPESGPARLDWKVILHPIIDKNNPPKSQEEFEKQYDNFKEQFEMVSRGMGMDEIQPVQDKKTKRAKIDYVFNNVRIKDWVNNEPELREDEIKERCWKGYTQKGMKTMFGKRYPNCVKKKTNEDITEYFDPIHFLKKKLRDEPKYLKDPSWIPYESEFQKLVDFVFKKTKKTNNLEHLDGFKVTKATPQSSQWVVLLSPVVEDWFNWAKNKQFQSSLSSFESDFREFFRMAGIDSPHSKDFPRDIQFVFTRAEL